MATEDRVTPLMASAQGGHQDSVEILLVHPNIEANFADFSLKF